MSGLEFLGLPAGAEIGDILERLYVFGVGLAALLALIMFVIGGIQYMITGDRDPGPAKERMKNAFWGLTLALTSWLILYTINPDLVLKIKINPIKIMGLQTPEAPRTESHSACVNDGTGKLTCRVVEGPGTNDCSACPGESGVWHCKQTDETFPDESTCQQKCIAPGNIRGTCTLLK